MVSQVSTVGSCTSRNIFNSEINEDYKKYFEVGYSIECVNFISLMSKPIDFDESLLDSDVDYTNVCVKEDLSKAYARSLEHLDVDYIIVDTYFDAFHNIIEYEGSYLSDSYERLRTCSFYENVKDNRVISPFDDFEEYFELFKEAIERFFDALNKNRFNPVVVLNCSRSVYRYYEDGKLVENENYRQISLKINKIRNIFDKHILENYDVEVLPFDKNTLADVNHIYDLYHVHYEKKYYLEKNSQLNEIIERNNKFDFNDNENVKRRYLARKILIMELETDLLKCDISDLKKEKEILTNNNRDLKKKHKQLKSKTDSLLNSHSWKITKPMRLLKKSIKK